MENEVSLPLRFPEICVSCTILIICTAPDGRRAFRQITKRSTKKNRRRRKDEDQAPEANYKTLARKEIYLAFKADGLGDWQEPLDKEEKEEESVII